MEWAISIFLALFPLAYINIPCHSDVEVTVNDMGVTRYNTVHINQLPTPLHRWGLVGKTINAWNADLFGGGGGGGGGWK